MTPQAMRRSGVAGRIRRFVVGTGIDDQRGSNSGASAASPWKSSLFREPDQAALYLA
jgi:hypothetical protein